MTMMSKLYIADGIFVVALFLGMLTMQDIHFIHWLELDGLQ